MNRMFITILSSMCLFLVFSVSVLYGGELKQKQAQKQVLTDQLEAKWLEKITVHDGDIARYNDRVAKGTLAPGDTILFTERDFSMNTTMGRKIALGGNGNLHTIGTRWVGAAGGNPYNEVYNFFDGTIGVFFGDVAIDPSITNELTRSGRVLNGANGEAYVSMHNHSNSTGYLYQDAGAGLYSFTQNIIGTGRFASADFDPTSNYTNWVTTLDMNADFVVDEFWNSTDGGATWSMATMPTPPSGFPPATVELYPHFSPGTSDVYLAYTEDGGGAVGYFMSSDLANTWSYTQVITDTTVVDGEFSYLVANFSQWMSENTADGTFHMVGNGYGFHHFFPHPDSVDYFIYPVIYWNSNMPTGTMVQLTDSVVGINPAFTDTLADGRSGNAIGNSFPSIAVEPNDGVVACIWSQVELDANNHIIMATHPDGTPDPVYFATDIWGAISFDNGVTWSDPVYLAGDATKSDKMPSAARWLEKDANGDYIIHFVYMYDKVPGSSVFGQNSELPPAAWIYSNYNFGTTGISDQPKNVVDNFRLEQNYPNPFNPSTTIDFSLRKSATVTLEVYNLLGEKVATLVNGRLTAGEHSVTFDATNFSSGVYFYKLSSGDFSQTRKMMLLK